MYLATQTAQSLLGWQSIERSNVVVVEVDRSFLRDFRANGHLHQLKKELTATLDGDGSSSPPADKVARFLSSTDIQFLSLECASIICCMQILQSAYRSSNARVPE